MHIDYLKQLILDQNKTAPVEAKLSKPSFLQVEINELTLMHKNKALTINRPTSSLLPPCEIAIRIVVQLAHEIFR